MNWSAPLDNRGSAVTHYILQWKEKSAGDYASSYQTSDATETSYIISSGLTEGSFYDVRVIAFNVVGGSDPSGATRIVAATRPAAPVSLTIDVQSSTQIAITWSAGDNGGTPILSYSVFVKSSSDATYTLAGQTSSSTLAFTKSDITPAQYGSSFDFVVTATTAADTSD